MKLPPWEGGLGWFLHCHGRDMFRQPGQDRAMEFFRLSLTSR